MAYTAVPTIVAGDPLTSSWGNTYIRDNAAFFKIPLDSSGKITAISSTYFASLSGANLTNLPAGQLTGTLPALDGSALTALNASNVASGTLGVARLPSAPYVAAYHNTTQGASSGLDFNTDIEDASAMHDTAGSPSVFTAVRAGLHLVTIGMKVRSTSVTNHILVALNGAGKVFGRAGVYATSTGVDYAFGTAGIVRLAVSDTVTVDHTATAGGGTASFQAGSATNAHVTLAWIGN